MPNSSLALHRYLDVSRQPAGSAFHTSQVSISFGEAMDAGVLRAAWEALEAAHPVLRAKFGADGAVSTADAPAFAWQTFDWQASPPEDLGAAWQALVDGDASAPIAVDSAPTCRFTIIRLPNGAGHALWSFHGALLDNDSISLVLHQWLHAYDSLRTSGEVPAFGTGDTSEPADSDDWKTSFDGLTVPRPLIVLPLPETPGASEIRRSVSHTFERPERAAFADAAKAMGADLYSLFGAAWAFVISRSTSSPDVLLLEPARPTGAIGRIERAVVHRCQVAAQTTSADLVRTFPSASTGPADLAAAAQALNFPVSALEPATSYVYRSLTLNDRLRLEMPRWMAADVQLMQKTSAPITLRVVANDRPEIALDYDPAHLSAEAAHALFEMFRGTLVAFAEDPKLVLGDFALPAGHAIVEGPEAPATFRSLVPQCLHEIFADAAAETPDRLALEMGEEKLTFSELNTAANQVARVLRKRGVNAGARVGLAMPRSPRWVTAALGILKAGGSIVPLPVTGKEKVAKISAWIVDALPEGEERDLPVIQMQAQAGELSSEKSRGLQNEVTPTSEAIVWLDQSITHTLSHEKLAALLQSSAAVLELTPEDRVLQFAPTSTFAAVGETFATLLSGATLVLRGEDRWATRTAFQEFVQESTISALSVPTPFWSQWTHYLSELSIPVPATLRLVVTTGTPPAINAAAAWRAVAGQTRLLHRTGDVSGAGLLTDPATEDVFAPALLGSPEPGILAQVVDEHGHPLPAGLPGHLEVSSKLTPKDFSPLGREAFVTAQGTFYDRARLQTLISGSSPATIREAIYLAATSHPEILDVHVEERLIAARQEWCLWIVPRDPQRGEPHDFREWLTGRLPAPTPRRIRALPRFPLDEAGQIDVTALEEPPVEDPVEKPSTKGSDAEERLRKIVSRTLGGRRIELDEILTDGRTKPQIAKLLHEAVVREEPRAELSDFTTGFSVRSLLRNVRSRKAAAPDSTWTPLQPLRASGKQTPLILVHDFDGESRLYGPLVAQLGADQPCYAITARGLSDPAAVQTSVPEMASTYIEALRVFDPAGPYQLMGYGFGGLVAFEMARQLHGAGANVSLLVLLAAEPPGGNAALGFLSGGWKRLFGKKPAEETKGRRRPQETPVSLANTEAAKKYTASSTPLLAHVFAPTEDFPDYRTLQSGWSACCGDVRLYQVPCSGPDMMAEPAVESLAEAISQLTRNEDLFADPEGEE